METRVVRPLESRLSALPDATIYHHERIPYGVVPDQDLLLVARLDVADDNNAVMIAGGTVGPCSCDLYGERGTCPHAQIARRWLDDQVPSAVRTAAALASDAAGLARTGRHAQARQVLSLARRLVAPHVSRGGAAKQVADGIEDVYALLPGLTLEVAA
jgi:hypothetical protein